LAHSAFAQCGRRRLILLRPAAVLVRNAAALGIWPAVVAVIVIGEAFRAAGRGLFRRAKGLRRTPADWLVVGIGLLRGA
jgi:hypothetical protein